MPMENSSEHPLHGLMMTFILVPIDCFNVRIVRNPKTLNDKTVWVVVGTRRINQIAVRF